MNEQAGNTAFRYHAPELQGQLKRFIRGRNLKEFKARGCAPITTEGSLERELLRINVSDDCYESERYQCMLD